MRHGYRKGQLSRAIVQEGPKLLEEIIPKDSDEKGCRIITWKLLRGLACSVVDSIMTKVEALQTSFYLRFSYTCQLRNIENGKVMLLHTNLGGSPILLTSHTAAREWLHEKDANRLDTNQVERPNTKWVFQRWVQVEVKAILVEQPLLGKVDCLTGCAIKKFVCTSHI